MTSWGYLRFYMTKYRRYFWMGVLSLAFTDILDVLPPLIIMKGVDQITRSEGMGALLTTSAFFAVTTLILAVVRYHWRMQFGRFHHNVARDLRDRIFKKFTELGPSFYNANPIGELMSLTSNDVEAVRMGMGPGIIVIVDAILYFLTIPPIMMTLSIPLTLKTLAVLPLLPFFISWISKIIHHRFLDVQDKFSEMSGICQENISGIRIVKGYAQEQNQIDIFNRSNEAWKRASLKVAWTESFMHPVMELCMTSGIVILLFAGTKDVVTGSLTIGAFVAFQRYISKMTWPMTAIGWGFSLIAQGQASLKRIDDFLNTVPDVTAPKAAQRKLDLHGAIEITNLTFSYPGFEKPVLKDINLKINQGDTLGIVGPVGSGKTTLVQLLCHLYEIPRQKIAFNGNDINDIPFNILRQHTSLVPQDTFLFSTSIIENMTFGMESTPDLEVLRRVAQVAKLDEEIEGLPNAFETQLGERGVNLSGGQKQRMTITRALVRKSPLVIFDDSLSAVDAETESLILRRLHQETKDLTTIIISHRLSSLAQCNRVVVLKDGRIEAEGTPGELKKKSEIYQELLQLQGYGI